MVLKGTLSDLSIDQVTVVLENAPMAVCVIDVADRELLYANRVERDLFLTSAYKQKRTCCHAVELGRFCPFCQESETSRSDLTVCQFRHPGNHRVYRFSHKIIDWNGKPARIEYMLDVTEVQAEKEHNRFIDEELQATFSSIPCGLCVYRFDGTHISPVFHNPAFYSIMGCSKEHIQSVERQRTNMGVHPDDLVPLQGRVQQALGCGGVFQHIYRLWNDTKREYRWIRMDGSVKSQDDGTKLLYAVYSDVSEQVRLERELTAANEKMQDIINAIPGGVAIYRVSNIFETVYFSDGVPELSGYNVEEYSELIKRDAVEMVYWEDVDMVVAKAREVIESHRISKLEFRKQHRDGHVVWVRAQIKWIGEDDGYPLLHCVFHNITDIKETQLQMDHLVNSIPGGIASYRTEGYGFIPTFISDGFLALSGYSREEFEKMISDNAFNVVYEADRERIIATARAALKKGNVLDVSYRMRHRDGNLIWVHLNGRRVDPLSDGTSFYAVFTGMSAESRLFQGIVNETADGIYVIDKENYDLLYVSESKELFRSGMDRVGQKCYEALHGKSAPCEFCTLKRHAPDGKAHDMTIEGTDRFYSTRFRETDWNGIPSYVKYVQDVTEEVVVQREKQRLEQYFQTVLRHLPGGVAVVRHERDGSMVPEFLSDGFASMTGMTLEEAWQLYRRNAMDGVHPDDLNRVQERIAEYMASSDSQCEIVYRLKKGDGSYLWVKNTLTMIQSEGGVRRVYAGYHDMTKEREEQEQIRQQYKEMIIQHYRTPGPNALVVGHCNVTQNRILEIIDYTNSDLLKTFGSIREEFFSGVAGLIVDETERQMFLNTYLNAPTLEAFKRGDTELILKSFIKLPNEVKGRYVEFKVNVVETPDTGDVTGILTVTDITEQTISDKILNQLSVSSYDLVVDVDLTKDSCTVLSCNHSSGDVPMPGVRHSEHVDHMLQKQVVPKDKKQVARLLDPDYMMDRLKRDGSYSFSYSIMGEKGDTLTKKLTISATDLRLGRVCLARADITDSVREQQRLLNVIAYTFELMAFVNISSGKLTMYTREIVLEKLSPLIIENYNESMESILEFYAPEGGREEVELAFSLKNMIKRLEEKPSGYDFVFPCRSEDGLKYKQINVLWGDGNKKTVCMVRADVTDILAAEHKTKNALEKALFLAEEANQAKSDFLSSMSHDIRTPMNAIMGMTALAIAHLDDVERVEECLRKISLSSRHLLTLINDVLDMSKIERSKITLNHVNISISDLVEQISSIMTPQVRDAGLHFEIKTEGISHQNFYGDSLRINQILINILSNAIKFTPEGGKVSFLAEEITPIQDEKHVRYRFSISDTGVGMSEDFMVHMFEPFTRNRNTARVEGTGLGLSITKGLVDLMDGDIHVESKVHRGTMFQVELECEAVLDGECTEACLEADSSYPANEDMLSGRCFLVVEDNAINSEILCELLQMHGAMSVVKTDGVQAVQAFQSAMPGTYDAILMDIQMPEMNGYEATRIIRKMERPDATEIPIIAMTANAFAEDIQASLDAGMSAHIAKPIDTQLLWTTLNRLLGSRNGE